MTKRETMTKTNTKTKTKINILENTFRERPERLVTFVTFGQSDEGTFT